MDEIRAVAGPIVQRYFDKIEEDRQIAQAKVDAENAKKREAAEKASAEKKAAEEPVSKEEEMSDAGEPKVDEALD
jgi:heat shock protein 4